VAETEETVGVGGSLKPPLRECKWISEKDRDFRAYRRQVTEKNQLSWRLLLR
jgi:hypothetical protein